MRLVTRDRRDREHAVSGHSIKPGDILRAKTGTTIEVLNTDAEGRLVLADCLAHAIDQGAERLVDLATLTGAIVTDARQHLRRPVRLRRRVVRRRSRPPAGAPASSCWRLPLHAEYDELIKSRYADIANAVEARKAGSITAAQFLRRFTGDVPWAHLDIAGTAYDNGKPYTPKGGAGFGVRTLVELARANAGAPDLH